MTKQDNESGNNIYAERDVNITYEPKKDEPKKHLTRLPRAIETFVGREDELKEIKESFESINTLVLVNGVGGIGKSAIARQFLNTHLNEYDYKVWINYKESLFDSIVNELNTLFEFDGKIEDIYKKIIYELNNLHGNNLMIIDNFDNPSIEDRREVKNFLPPKFKILITSRDKIDDIKEIRVEELSEDKAIKLFQKHYKGEFNKEELKELLVLIGYHSLLIELVAKALNSYSNTLRKVLEIFSKRELKELKTKVNLRDKKALIVEHIRELFNLNTLIDSQILILKRFSILGIQEIEFNDLTQIFGVEDIEEFGENLRELVEKGWINENNKSFKIHPLIIEFINLDNKITYEEAEDIVDYYIDKIEETYKINPIDGFKYIPFAKNILDIIVEKNERIAILTNNLSIVYRNLGDFKSALKFAKKSLKIREKIFYKNHPSLATSYNNLSMIYQDLGDLKNALSYAKKSNEIFEKILYKNHPDLTQAYNNLSTIYFSLRDLKSALNYAKKSLEIREKIFDKNHPDLAISYTNISLIYLDLGELQNALSYAKKSLEIGEKIFYKNHPSLATSYNNLSLIYQDLGELQNALDYAKKDIGIREKIFDKNHPSLATSYNNLSLIYQDLGEIESALEFAKKSLEIREKTFDKNHPSLATSYNNISTIYFYLKEYETAKEYMIKAINIRKKIFPNGHPHLDSSREWLRIIEGYL